MYGNIFICRQLNLRQSNAAMEMAENSLRVQKNNVVNLTTLFSGN